MNTFWLKIMGLAVLAVGIIILISVFTSGTDSQPPEPQPKEPQKTVYDQWEEDDKRLNAEPQYIAPIDTNAPAQQDTRTAQQTAPVPPPKPVFKSLS